MRYEDLHKKPVDELRKISENFGFEFSQKNAEKAVEYCSFTNMRKREKKMIAQKKLVKVNKDEFFFRKGETGSWKQHFNIRQNEEFFKFAGETARQFGYFK